MDHDVARLRGTLSQCPLLSWWGRQQLYTGWYTRDSRLILAQDTAGSEHLWDLRVQVLTLSMCPSVMVCVPPVLHCPTPFAVGFPWLPPPYFSPHLRH